jgi:hypothetical protein
MGVAFVAEFIVSCGRESDEATIKASTPYAAAHRYAEKYLADGVLDDDEYLVTVISRETGLRLRYVIRASVKIHWGVTKEDSIAGRRCR